jgi:BCD family chlorophyll transporter-like MFS transporter
MMMLADKGTEAREGVRMGLWGAAQAIAFGVGGFLGTVASDVAHALLGVPAAAYGTVFAAEAALFLVSAVLAARIGRTRADGADSQMPAGEKLAAGLGGG